jgi:hypothetical protein
MFQGYSPAAFFTKLLVLFGTRHVHMFRNNKRLDFCRYGGSFFFLKRQQA